MDGESTVEIASPTAIENAMVTSEHAAIVAEGAASTAEQSAVVAEVAAAEVIEQLEEDEKWLENRLQEIQMENQETRRLMMEALSPLMGTLTQQAQLIQSLSERVGMLSTPATLSPANPEIPIPEVVVPENVVEENPEPRTNPETRRKHHRI